MRELFEGWSPETDSAITPRQALDVPEADPNVRTTAEDACWARLPGDDPSGHPVFIPENPMVRLGYTKLLAMLRQGGLGHDEQRLVQDALCMIEDGPHGVPGPDGQHGEPPPDQVEILVYDQPETSYDPVTRRDEPVYDATGRIWAQPMSDVRAPVPQSSGD